MHPHRRPLLGPDPFLRESLALWRAVPAMPCQRVAAGEEVPAIVAEVEFERVRLLGVAVPSVVLPILQSSVRTKATLELADGPTREVVRSSLEEAPLPLGESPWDLEVGGLHVLPLPVVGAIDNPLLPHDAAAVVLRRFLYTPLDP